MFLIKLGLLKTGLVEWAQQFFHTSSFTTPSPPKEAAVKYTLIDQKLCSAGKAALGYFRKKKKKSIPQFFCFDEQAAPPCLSWDSAGHGAP